MTVLKYAYKLKELHGISCYELYPNGALKECVLNELNEIDTDYGVLVPQYEDAGIRRKNAHSLSYYPNGQLKSISLQDQTNIETSIGIFPAEYITFYEDGHIKRLFPLNGKLSGYWSEEDEGELTEEFSFSFSFGSFKCKIISIFFYKSGRIKSLTFWPNEKLSINTPLGEIPAKIGLSLFESGNIKTIEPRFPIKLQTPIGTLTAFNPDAVGINGDINSVSFYEDGRVNSLITSTDVVKVISSTGDSLEFMPEKRPSYISEDSEEIVPLHIEFSNDTVRFNGIAEFNISTNKFSISKLAYTCKSACSSCASCTGCS